MAAFAEAATATTAKASTTATKATTNTKASTASTITNTAKENVNYIDIEGRKTKSFWEAYEDATGKSYADFQAQAAASAASAAYTYASSAINNGLASKLQQLASYENNTTVNVNIDHVQDYNDLVTQLQNDGRFTSMMQDATLSDLLGKNKLSKYGYY